MKEFYEMFNPLTIPYESKMLFNVVKLKDGYTVEDAEMAMGEMCNVVKNTYRDAGGFIAGQVFKYGGFVSDEGSLGGAQEDRKQCLADDHLAIVTYWNSFEQHEDSHSHPVFKEKFSALAEMCEDTFEIGYEMLWQGEPE
jgi:hypothetical protein